MKPFIKYSNYSNTVNWGDINFDPHISVINGDRGSNNEQLKGLESWHLFEPLIFIFHCDMGVQIWGPKLPNF